MFALRSTQTSASSRFGQHRGVLLTARQSLQRVTQSTLVPSRARQTSLKVCASADGSDGAQQGPREVSLLRKWPGAGATFMLAGFLKILTMGWLASSAPRGCIRTPLGEVSQFLLVPVGLLLCLIAKRIVDSGLTENKGFMRLLLGGVAVAYFGVYPLLYRYVPKGFQDMRYGGLPTEARRSAYDEPAPRKFIIQHHLEAMDESTKASSSSAAAGLTSRTPEMFSADVDQYVGQEGGRGQGSRRIIPVGRQGAGRPSARAPVAEATSDDWL